MINIGVLGSTNGTDLQAVLDAADKKMIDASINIVISNRKNAYIRFAPLGATERDMPLLRLV